MIKILMLIAACVLHVSNAQAQNSSPKDTTIILKNDIYSNPRKTSNPPSPELTIPYEVNTNGVKPALIALDYKSMAAKADSLFAGKKYNEAIGLYTTAFSKNNDLGLVKHRYNLACCYVSTNEYDKAITQLYRIAEKGNYFNYAELEAETFFKPLHSHKKWKPLVSLVKKNAQELIDAAELNRGNNQ